MKDKNDLTEDELDFIDVAACAALTAIINRDYDLDYHQAASMAYDYAIDMLTQRQSQRS